MARELGPGDVLAAAVGVIAIGSLATALYRTYKISEALKRKEL